MDDKVIDSRLGKDGDIIRRRRECLKCERRFTTYERVEDVLPMVVKKDGRREPFDRNKILLGIKKACEKRPISVQAVEKVVDEDRGELLGGVRSGGQEHRDRREGDEIPEGPG